MKRFTKICSCFLLLAVLFSIAPASAFAAGRVRITPGRSFRLRKSTTQYVLTLKQDSLVKVTWSGHKKSDYTYIWAYSDKKCSSSNWAFYSNGSPGYRMDKAKGSFYFCAGKGNTYFKMLDQKGTTKLKFTVTPQNKINTDNYKKANAMSLSPNKWVTVAQTPNYQYTRWYKVVLNETQEIAVNTNEGGGNYIRILNSNSRSVPIARGSKLVMTEDPLPPGTYYIIVGGYYTDNSTRGYIRFKWS